MRLAANKKNNPYLTIMYPKIEQREGWTDVIINDNCDYDLFYKVAGLLQSHFGLIFSKELEDFDDLYWDFEYKGHQLCLHYNVYLGISIFPRAFKDSTAADNDAAIEIGKLVTGQLAIQEATAQANTKTARKDNYRRSALLINTIMVLIGFAGFQALANYFVAAGIVFICLVWLLYFLLSIKWKDDWQTIPLMLTLIHALCWSAVYAFRYFAFGVGLLS